MLRVGLTGGLGSGKSTVAAQLRALGAQVIEADELGRALMEPGHQVYDEIVRAFGPESSAPMAASTAPAWPSSPSAKAASNELNAIVHPAVIAAQQRWMEGVFARDPAAVAVVESALIFEVERDARARGESEGTLADWRNRFDRILVLTAPDDVKIARYVARLNPDPAVADGRPPGRRAPPPGAADARCGKGRARRFRHREYRRPGSAARPRGRTSGERLKAESNQNAASGSLK